MQANRALLRFVVALVVLAGVYGGLAAFLSGQVPSNARVDGVAIGGMSPREATVTLKRVLAPKAAQPVHLMAQSRTIDIQPGAAGLEIDLEGTLSNLSGFTLDPRKLWAHLTGAENQPLKYRVDRGKLTAAVNKAARAFDTPVKEGSITFAAGKAAVVVPVAGRAFRVAETTDAVVAAWPLRPNVQAVIKVTEPKLAADEVKRAAKELALPAMSGPVRLRAGKALVLLEPRQYAPALSVTPDGAGKLSLIIDAPKLLTAIRKDAPDLERAPVDASLVLDAGKPRVVPAVVGTKLDSPRLPTAFLAALTSPTRTATVSVLPLPPKVTTAMAQSWKVEGPISTFTTQFPVNPPRTNNIKLAVATLNDTVVPPGAQFSLNATLGQRTPAKGYQQAPVINDGRLENDYGGGVSQVSTTTFNAAFFAGVRIDRYTPHSFYIARYPEGREATVSWPDVDQKWTNDTGGVIFIQASVRGSDLTVTFLGTKKWDVEAVKGARRNVVQPKNIVDARPGCVPQVPTPGFDVTVAQIFKKVGVPVRTRDFNTHYIPEDSVRCTNPAAG